MYNSPCAKATTAAGTAMEKAGKGWRRLERKGTTAIAVRRGKIILYKYEFNVFSSSLASAAP